jgi:hypothetical protein
MKTKESTLEDLLKENFKNGRTAIFSNERTASDDLRIMTCSFRDEPINTWANGFNIEFNGANFSFKTFKAFFKKFNQLKADWNLELHSW